MRGFCVVQKHVVICPIILGPIRLNLCLPDFRPNTFTWKQELFCVCESFFFENTKPPGLMKYPVKDQVTPSVQKEAY